MLGGEEESVGFEWVACGLSVDGVMVLEGVAFAAAMAAAAVAATPGLVKMTGYTDVAVSIVDVAVIVELMIDLSSASS